MQMVQFIYYKYIKPKKKIVFYNNNCIRKIKKAFNLLFPAALNWYILNIVAKRNWRDKNEFRKQNENG